MPETATELSHAKELQIATYNLVCADSSLNYPYDRKINALHDAAHMFGLDMCQYSELEDGKQVSVQWAKGAHRPIVLMRTGGVEFPLTTDQFEYKVRDLCRYYGAEVQSAYEIGTRWFYQLARVAASLGEGAQRKFYETLYYLLTAKGLRTNIYQDFAPLSYCFLWKNKETKKPIMNGGVIYSGPGLPANGSAPSCSVSLDPDAASGRKHMWSVHT